MTEATFVENKEDQSKDQSYKNQFKNYSLPSKYYLVEMYNKQKELQTFLKSKGKTQEFPNNIMNVKQPNVQLAIYHLFCMQIEFNELKVELSNLVNNPDNSNVDDARFELIDMFFFMFNVGIYTGLDIMAVMEEMNSFIIDNRETEPNYFDTNDITFAIGDLMNYIDKLPWKAWKEYDYSKFDFNNREIISYYALALSGMVDWAKRTFKETDESLFNLYMNKWEENKRRQVDINSGYILSDITENSDKN